MHTQWNTLLHYNQSTILVLRHLTPFKIAPESSLALLATTEMVFMQPCKIATDRRERLAQDFNDLTAGLKGSGIMQHKADQSLWYLEQRS